jgi:hypothetical protein
MSTIESPGSGSSSFQTKEPRDLLLAQVHEIRVKIRDGIKEKPGMPDDIRSQLNGRARELMIEYFAQLPRYVFGRCPVCNALLEQVFDPWGLDGFWWQETSSGWCPKPSACEHFRVLTGALNLNGKPPLGGEAESHPGPEVPYVIPKALSMPTMIAVISSISMKNGYAAYPISYFSPEKPPTAALANPWTKTSCNFINPKTGRPAFTIKTDPWDFELMPWIEKGKVHWIEAGDPQNMLKSAPANQCPYVNLKGLRLQQTIKNDKCFTKPPPNKEVVNPFSD